MGHSPTQPRPVLVRQVQSVNGDNRGGADCYSFLRTAQSQPSNLDSNQSSFYMSGGDEHWQRPGLAKPSPAQTRTSMPSSVHQWR